MSELIAWPCIPIFSIFIYLLFVRIIILDFSYPSVVLLEWSMQNYIRCFSFLESGRQPVRNTLVLPGDDPAMCFVPALFRSHLHQMIFVCLAVPCKGMRVVSFGISLERIHCDCRASGDLFFFSSVER